MLDAVSVQRAAGNFERSLKVKFLLYCIVLQNVYKVYIASVSSLNGKRVVYVFVIDAVTLNSDLLKTRLVM